MNQKTCLPEEVDDDLSDDLPPEPVLEMPEPRRYFIGSPHFLHPEQAAEFVKEVIAECED